MRIRKFIIEDYEEVFALWQKTPGMGLNMRDDSKEGIAKYLERNSDTCFVAEEKKKKRIIGIIHSGHDGRRRYIYHVAVERDAQKQGIGTMLVNSALCALKEQGIHKVALVAFHSNEEGNLFWDALGFEAREDLVYRNRRINEENQ